ncbi:phytoene desaturase family protein [Acidipropionibacterium acidipropionici]|uniref:phytoene desaturase family protein n=1 Tax=Acidipropionibacterium acidipropionici TaxID=1748 RepID=UPI00110AB42F|nr:phytoene desaturase family protein [Acidipropionibacterium acidipropionici]QCV96530.1 phytoene desaturase [Acidipropionibacterium acidipropionici]
MSRVVIIGAGVAGLATAALLAHQGHEVEVLEGRDDVGGRAGSLTRDGFRFDTGPSWYLMPEVFEHFFELLGTSSAEQLDLRTLDPGYAVFSEPDPGAPASPPVIIPRGQDAVERVFESREPGSRTALRSYLDSAARTSRLAQEYFLYNPYTRLRPILTPEITRSLPDLAGLLTQSLADHISRRFRDPVLRQVLGYPAVFLGTSPDRAPAMYHLMSAFDLAEGVQYPIGGFWELVRRIEDLARAEGVRITTGARVTQIITDARDAGRATSPGSRRPHPLGRLLRRPRPRRVTGVTWRSADGRDRHTEAEIVVSAADLHHTETRLLAPNARSFPERWWRRRVSGPGAVLVMLGVRGRLPELPHHSLFFTRDWDTNFAAIFGDAPHIPDPASIYLCKPSQTDDTVAPEGDENLFVLVPVPADPGLGHGGPDGTGSPAIERTADAAIDQISRWAGIPDLASRILVRHTVGPQDFADQYHSWHGGMLGPGHILRQSAMFRAQNQSRRVDGLYYAGATTAPGVGVPMCLISAELVLKRITGDHSAGPTAPHPSPTTRTSPVPPPASSVRTSSPHPFPADPSASDPSPTHAASKETP